MSSNFITIELEGQKINIECRDGKFVKPDILKATSGYKSSLKPAMELIVVAQKPVDGTYAENALKWGVAGFWIDGGRIPYAEDEPDNRVGTDFISRDGDASLNANDNQVPNKYYVQMYKPQGRFPANFILSYPEDEYELRDDVSAEDLRKLARWMDENAQY